MKLVLVATLCVAVFAGEAILSAPAASAMTILEAADRLNALTPQSIPRQTIQVGTYDGTAKQFYWNLEEGYPPNIPGYKQEEQGGPAKPHHFAVITSFNVTYEFEIRNRPSNFNLKVSIPDGAGQLVEHPATISGNIARVSFNPRSSGYQWVTMTGLAERLRITPLLLPQLGAFVVPRLLITIIYEPPGGQSWAKYGTSSTAGTVVSWGFARSNSDIVKTVNEDEMRENFIKGVTIGLQVLGTVVPAYKPATETAAGVLNTFNQILGNTTMQTTRTVTSASSQTNGTFFALDTWYQTDPHDTLGYPGQGDVFVFLEDVLFVYAVVGGKVGLTPVGYKWARKLASSQLDGYLSPALAAKYRELDPWFGGMPGWRASGETPSVFTPLGVQKPRGALTAPPAPRFKHMYERACDIHGGEGNQVTQTTVAGSGATTATTTTTVTKVTGHLASLMGKAGETTESLTYWNSRQMWNISSESAAIYLDCTESEGAFRVDMYLDTLLGTFFSAKGQPLDYLAGTVTDSQGRPMPNQTVTLAIGGQIYTAVANPKGQFKFRLTSLPSGPGRVSVGASAVAVSYAGRPITNLKVTVGAAPTTAPGVGEPGVQPKVPRR